MGDCPLSMQAAVCLGDERIGRLVPDQREVDSLGNRFERAIVEGRPQTSRGTDHPGTMLHGSVELTYDLLGYVIDDANAADLPTHTGQFLRQPIGIGVEHTAAQELAPDRNPLHPAHWCTVGCAAVHPVYPPGVALVRNAPP